MNSSGEPNIAFTPTPHQRAAITAVEQALARDNQAFLRGYAGTGKTALLSNWFAAKLDRPLFLAPTNRAAFVMRAKLPAAVDVPVMTLHAAAMKIKHETHADAIRLWETLVRTEGSQDRSFEVLRRWHETGPKGPISDREWEAAAALVDRGGGATLKEAIGRQLKRVRGENELVFSSADENAITANTLVVDEASMVSLRMRDHLVAAFPNTPILWVGDPAQLPPIVPEGEPPGSVLDAHAATAELTEVLRQTGDDHPDSPKRIALLANYLREEVAAPFPNKWAGQVDSQSVTIITRPKSKLTKGLLRQFADVIEADGVVLCWRNDTRQAINRRLRGLLGLEAGDPDKPPWLPVEGERLIVSQAPSLEGRDEMEDPVTGQRLDDGCTLTKGELVVLSEDATLVSDGAYQWVRLVSAYDGFGRQPLHVPAGPFLATYQLREDGTYAFPRRGGFQFDYGLAATVHKAQGSQFPSVAVYEQFPYLPPTPEQEKLKQFPAPDAVQHRKWLYTAITRATHRLLLVCEPSKPRGWK